MRTDRGSQAVLRAGPLQIVLSFEAAGHLLFCTAGKGRGAFSTFHFSKREKKNVTTFGAAKWKWKTAQSLWVVKSTKTTFFSPFQSPHTHTLSLSSSDCKFIWCWISIRNKTLMSGFQERHFLCCQTATVRIFSWFIEIIPSRVLEGKRQRLAGGTNGFLSLTCFSVCAKGLLKPSWLQSHQSPPFQQNSFALVSCWKLLSDAGRLRS